MLIRRGHTTAVPALALAAIAIGGCSFGSSASKSTESFFTSLGDGKGPEACKNVAAGAKPQVLGAVAQGQAQRTAARQGDCQAFARALSSRRRDLFATVVVDPAPSSGGKTFTARFELDPKKPVLPYSVRLNKRNDEWRIVSINSGGPP